MTECSAVDKGGIVVLLAGGSVWTPHSMYDLSVVDDILYQIGAWRKAQSQKGSELNMGVVGQDANPRSSNLTVKDAPRHNCDVVASGVRSSVTVLHCLNTNATDGRF